MPRFRSSIVWLAALFVVTGAALGSAQVGDLDVDLPVDPPTLEAGEEVPDIEQTEPARAADDEGEAPEDTDDASGSGERKLNHGYYVSQAAHCEDVDDPETPEEPDFTAPEDCEGAGHGGYVSSVAKSSLGKKSKDKAKD